MKNVIFLTVDALSYSRLGVGGNRPSPSPTIDRLISEGLSFSRLFAVGCPTMFASPGLFTSSLPLDDGGYGFGIRGRGTSFVEVFRDAGYRTAGFSTGPYQGRIYGYDRGFDEFYSLWDLGLYRKIMKGLNLDYLTSMHLSGQMSFEEAVGTLHTQLPTFLEGIAWFCREKAAEVAGGWITPSPVLHRWNFTAIATALENALREYRADPDGYAAHLLREHGTWSVFNLFDPDDPRSPQWVPSEIDALLEREGYEQAQQRLGPSGAYVLGQLSRWVESNPQRLFFAWAHLLDCHDLSFTSYDVAGADVEAEIKRASLHRERIRALGEAYEGSQAYDLAIRYVDEQLEVFLGWLDRSGLRDDTLLVLGSDHGGWRNQSPPRPAGTNYMNFFDEQYHVPLVFSDPGIEPRRVDGLASGLDIAPTLLGLCGLEAPSDFRGHDAAAPGWLGREHVIMEHTGSGPCDFRHKQLNVCIRGKEHKLVCQIPALPTGLDGVLSERYDLRTDPREQVNLAGSEQFPAELHPLIEVIERRVHELLAHNFPNGVDLDSTSQAEPDLAAAT